jgi:hypothetical protein
VTHACAGICLSTELSLSCIGAWQSKID